MTNDKPQKWVQVNFVTTIEGNARAATTVVAHGMLTPSRPSGPRSAKIPVSLLFALYTLPLPDNSMLRHLVSVGDLIIS